MNRNEILEKLTDIFRDVFDEEDMTITEETSAKDIEDWDSLMHISLIMAIENTFNMKFAMDEVVNLKNVGGIVDILARKG